MANRGRPKRTGIEIQTREPEVTTRDPQPVERERYDDKPARLLPVVLPKCTRCGGTRFHRNCATRPSMASDKMTRRKQCYECGQWHVMQSDPTPDERRKYWPVLVLK